MSELSELSSIFANYVSGEITPGELQLLEVALLEDVMLRREFIEYLNIDSGLGDLVALTSAEVKQIERETVADAVSKSTLTNKAIVRKGRQFKKLLSIVAVVTIILSFVTIFWIGPTNRSNNPVAKLITGVDALLHRDGQIWGKHDLTVGNYELNRGLLHLEFSGGVTVYLEAPAHFEPLSGQRLLLHSGRISSNVPPEGIGFTVETPEARVVDFGTEFSVEVDGGASEVHVFNGLVRVQPTSGENKKLHSAVDLRTSQAVKINDRGDRPVEIELAKDRFIRTFDESRRDYAHTVASLSPVAFYRMAIRDEGLACLPPEHSGVVLLGEGMRPPHACGVFSGGSLRVLAESTGRGGRVDTPPQLRTGQFTLSAFVYLKSNDHSGIVATNFHKSGGNFSLALNEQGFLEATILNKEGQVTSIISNSIVEPEMWRHVVMTADGEQLRLYEDGQLIASTPCSSVVDSEADTLWFGTDSEGLNLWDGRIDEVAMFDRTVSDLEISNMYQAALEEIGKSE